MNTREEDVDYIVCGSAPIAAGSQQLACALCGANVFVSPTGQDMRSENPGLTPICIDCVNPRQDDTFMPLTEAQKEELKAYGVTDEEIKRALWNLQLPKEERL